MSRASCSSSPMTLSSENSVETIASPTGSDAPVAATAAPVTATAAYFAATGATLSIWSGAAACLGRSLALEGASGKATSASGGDPTGVASRRGACGDTGSVIVEASPFDGWVR